jgi:hypothetical protein
MAIEITYARLRRGLSRVLDRVGDNREVVIVRRRGLADVALANRVAAGWNPKGLKTSPALDQLP